MTFRSKGALDHPAFPFSATFSIHRKGRLFCFVIGFSVSYFGWAVIECLFSLDSGGFLCLFRLGRL